MRENVITVPHIANSRAFTPVLVNRRLIKEAGVDVRIFYEDKPELYDADCVIFDGRVYRKWSEGDNERGVTSFLERLNRRILGRSDQRPRGGRQGRLMDREDTF